MKDVSLSVGRHLRVLRQKSGMSQFDAAVRAGWHISKVRRFESGRAPVTLTDLLTYSDVLSIPVCSICPVQTNCDVAADHHEGDRP